MRSSSAIQPSMPGNSVGSGAVIGPDTTLIGTQVGAGAHVLRNHCDSAVIHGHATVGPFTFLRPGTGWVSEARSVPSSRKKQSTIGPGSRCRTCRTWVTPGSVKDQHWRGNDLRANYDGEHKHATVVGDHVRVGSDFDLGRACDNWRRIAYRGRFCHHGRCSGQCNRDRTSVRSTSKVGWRESTRDLSADAAASWKSTE